MLAIYITAGYPSLDASAQALRVLDNEGIDIIELGVPFSDPLADGPVIQKASHQALEQGVNLDKIFELVKASRKEGFKTKNKGLDNIILFSYYNPLFVYGFEKIIQNCLDTGIRGILIPDLPVDEAASLSAQFKAAGLDLVLLAAITSTDERLEKIAKLSRPFVYLVSRIGVTGSAKDIESLGGSSDDGTKRIEAVITKLKKYNPQGLIGLGFGIDSKSAVEDAYKQGADIAIVGSKAITELETGDMKKFSSFICELNSASRSTSLK